MKRKPFPIERVWKYIQRGSPNECWPWIAPRGGVGPYPIVRINGRAMGAHRLVVELTTGVAVPPHLHVCHRCDNPRCLNPAHLFVGTTQDNSADRVAKGRQAKWEKLKHRKIYRGDEIYCAKLTTADVIAIKRALETPFRGIYNRLAEHYGVSRVAIRHIATGRNWKHVS